MIGWQSYRTESNRIAERKTAPAFVMYRERGVGSKSEVTSADRKRINDVLDKQLERSSPSTSRAAGINGKDRSSSSSLLAAAKDSRSASVTAPISKNSNASDGSRFLLFSYDLISFQCQSRQPNPNPFRSWPYLYRLRVMLIRAL